MSAPGVVVVEVRGLPKPAGSKRVFLVGKGAARRPVVTDASGRPGRDWRVTVQYAIERVHRGAPLEGPLEVCFYFIMPRPRGHLRADGKTLRPSARAYPTTVPDVTKLVRAVEDAATGLLWRDDAQVVTQTATKRYGDRPGVLIHCRPLAAGEGGKHVNRVGR
jgi:crossover junction endodeoxyribonuclease RusA